MLTVKVDGLRQLEAALAQLPKATAKNVVTRTLKSAAEPVDSEASRNAPEMTGRLQKSVIVGTRLTRSQRTGGARRMRDGSFRSESKNYVELHIGTSMSRGMFTEFGTFKDRAQMWFSRAWAATKMRSLEIITSNLRNEIDRAAARLARKAAKR